MISTILDLKLYKVMCKRIVCMFWQYFELTDKNKKVVLKKWWVKLAFFFYTSVNFGEIRTRLI